MRGLKSLREVTAAMDRKRMPPCDITGQISALFRLEEGRLHAHKSGEVLFLSSPDKTVRYALKGMEAQILSYLASRGHGDLRRVLWSAE
jgi:hypothetical protein